MYKVPIYLFAQPVELTTPSDMQNYKLPSETDHKKKSSGNTKPLNLKIRINPGDYSIAVDANTGFTIHELKESIVVAAAESVSNSYSCHCYAQNLMFLFRKKEFPP